MKTVTEQRLSTRCQLQYLYPQLQVWRDCAQKVSLRDGYVQVDGICRAVCDDHLDQVSKVQRAGLTGRLRWTENPKPPRRRPLGVPGQLSLD